MIGYMPGHMPWKFGEKLNELGVSIINKKADKTCCIDRKLITGASPKAANDFGKLSAIELLKAVKINFGLLHFFVILHPDDPAFSSIVN